VIDYFNPSTYNYLLGKSILVAPIISSNTTAFKVDLPKGDSWVYWWNHSITCAGGSSFHFNGSVPLEEFPVFFVNGNFCAARE
jgi:alpha-glucosidase (family GH31 glycosyl hydrolase)